MIPKYPIPFLIDSDSNCGISTLWRSSAGDHQLDCAVPCEFEGPGGAFSPEDLFGLALANCFVGTFKVMAEKSRLNYEKITVLGQLMVDLDDGKRPCMRDFHLKIQLTAPSDPERAERLVKKAIESGFILNSVKTKLTYEVAYI